MNNLEDRVAAKSLLGQMEERNTYFAGRGNLCFVTTANGVYAP